MNREVLANLVALGEGFTTEFKRAGTSNLGSAQVGDQVGTKSGLGRDQIAGEVTGEVTDDVAGEVMRIGLALKSKPGTGAGAELQKALQLKGKPTSEIAISSQHSMAVGST